MRFLWDFIHQNTPDAGKSAPAYYRNALAVCEVLLCVYFPLSFLLFGLLVQRWEPIPLLLLALSLTALKGLDRMRTRTSFATCAGIILVWLAWYIRTFGWGSGAQHLVFALLVLVFFDVCKSPLLKICLFLGLLSYRMLLFAWSQHHPALCALDRGQGIALQTLNSLTVFIMLGCLCILFSTNTQDTERQLRIVNQTLHREAGTDPLTQLPNRRAMLDVIGLYLENTPREPFGVAIADIDFFKRVNDTYGHNCGDYTLQRLAELFRASAGSEYSVCRWGGEEFCFFLPGRNLDEAALAMNDLCSAVRKMPLSFDGNDFSITVTIGVSENDFRSPMSAILEEADRKLYLGKRNGRDQVVV